MINFLKEYLATNYFDNINKHNISIIKTQNGVGHAKKKVVFYIFKKNKKQPELVVYSARNKDFNNILEKSIEDTKVNKNFAPDVLFEDYHNAIFFVGLKFVGPHKFDLSNKKHVNLAFDYFTEEYNKNKKVNTKSIVELYQDVINNFSIINIDVTKLVGDKLDVLKDMRFPMIKQHGDFQDNNIFIVDGKLKIIDWDDYGFCQFPLFDVYTLYLKYIRKIGKDDFIKNKLEDFYKLGDFGEIKEDVYKVFYYLYDFLRKDRLHNKFERKKYYLELENKLKKI